MTRNRTTRTRRGFSLIELLTVIAILGVLSAIFVGVLVSVRGDAAQRGTKETLDKIHAALDQQVKMIADKAKKDRQNKVPEFMSLIGFCNGDEERAEALWVHINIRRQFPQTFAEATSPVNIVGLGSYPANPAFRNATGAIPADQQAAVLLYMSLSELSRGDGGVNTDQFSPSDLPNTNFRVIRDAWGTHIAFVRFAMNVELQQPTFAPVGGIRDPFDPRAKLASTTWTNRTAAETGLGFTAGALFNGQNKVLTAWSAGPNRVFDTIANALGSDDVLGYRVRKLGTKAD